MRTYELMLILPAEADDKVVAGVTERITQVLSGSGGEIQKETRWGRRRFAYELDRKTERAPLLAAILAVAINTPISIVTVGSLGVTGVALGIVVGSWIEAAVLLEILRRRRTAFDAGSVLGAVPAMLVATVAAAVVAGLVLAGMGTVIGTAPGKLGVFAELVLATGAGGLVYVGVSRLLRVAEVSTLIGLAMSALRREPAS